MSQISPPIRIVLVLAVAVLGAYMLFLRPKVEEVPPAEPAPNVQTNEPAVSQPGKVAEAAQGAVDAADSQLKAQESVDGVDAGEAAAGTQSATKGAPNSATPAAAATPAVDVAGLPKPIANAIRKHKALVLLFWNGKSADDKAVHAALKHVDRWDGRVFVASAPITQIAKYGRIARGVNVEQSPTVVVADPELRAETLVGYVDSETIDQAVVDAFRNSSGLYTDPYLRKVNSLCNRTSDKIASIPTPDNGKQFATAADRYAATVFSFNRDFASIKPTNKWRGWSKAAVKDVDAYAFAWTHMASKAQAKPTTANVVAIVNAAAPDLKKINGRITKRFDSEHLFGCGSGH